MGFWDLVKTGLFIKGVNDMLNSGKKNTHSGYDPGAWRRDLDKENDSYSHLYNDNDL